MKKKKKTCRTSGCRHRPSAPAAPERDRERERESESEREIYTPGYEPFALHAPIQWAI